MGLSGLDSALSGLRVAQQQMSTISSNISNASTPGYTRKILPQETVTVGGESVGVRSRAVIRNVDLNLSRDLWTQVSSVTFHDVQIEYLNRIQDFHGPPELEVSVAAEIAELRDIFSDLADTPEDEFKLAETVQQAGVVAGKLNDLSALIIEMRNDAQDDVSLSVNEINGMLDQIAETNKQIKFNKISGKTTAALEDLRDQTIKALSQELEVNFFTRGDGVMVVQTVNGVQLADERAETLYFGKTVIGVDSYYPDSAAGIYVGGDPATNPNAIDITESGLNGRLGSLIELRDEVMPRQMALADEIAHKLALRFDAQGLRLFTDSDGTIPADTPPDLTTDPRTPVEYVGFSSTIRVNDAIIDDNSLLRTGTVPTDNPVQEGSNEVIRRVLENTFGSVSYQQADGVYDLRASGGGATLQEWLGVYSQNSVLGAVDVGGYTDLNAMLNANPDVFGDPVTLDSFSLTFEEARAVPALGPTTVTIDLSDAQINQPIDGVVIKDAADQLAAEINSQIALAGVPAALNAQASRNIYGQLVFESTGNITVDGGIPGGMLDSGLELLGLQSGTFETTDPWIEVQIGNDAPVRVSIEPGEDENDLVAKLDKINATDAGVAGLAVEIDPATGFLTLRPGDDVNNPTFGGELNITAGSFEADGAGLGVPAIAAGTGLIESLFGTATPIADYSYTSEVQAVTPPTTPSTVAFRSRYLGAGANIDTGIISSVDLIDYTQKMINRQAEEINALEARNADETSFRDLLDQRLLDESGVNIDEELSNLIVVQTAYSAAAKVISAIDEQFRALLNAF